MNGIIVNNDHSGRSCANQTMILSAGNGLSASNTVSYAYDSIGRLGLNPSYNHLNLAGEIGAASGDQLHYTHVYDGTKLRSVIDGDTGTVVEASDYYPFGKRIQVTAPVSEPVEGSQHASKPAVAPVATATSVASTSSPNRWRFSGKEGQSFLGAGIPLLDFGARMYNPAIARWTAADPLSEKYYGISPYDYCIGNPIINVDLDGQEIRFFEVSQYLGKTPQYQYSKTVEDANSGEYSVMAYYDENDNIVGYGASRNGRLEYVMDESDDISTFFKNLPNNSSLIFPVPKRPWQ